MAEFKKNARFSGGPNRSFNKGPSRDFGSRSGGGRDFDQKELFEAQCSSCGKTCRVPFRPNGKKPVYCSDCFQKDGDRPKPPRFEKKEYGPSRPSFNREASRPEDGRIDAISRQLTAMNATLEKLVAALETSNRAGALTKEMSKYIPTEEPKSSKKASAKKTSKKPSKKA